jgi:hypothetical protein
VSDVTNLVLLMSTTDASLHTIADELDRLAEVDRYFDDGFGLVGVQDDVWYGGGKASEASMAIGAMNHLDLDSFVAHLQSMDWAVRHEVQLVVKGQQDFRFRVIDVFPDAEIEIDRFWENGS